jgi:hypothetical protein
MARDIFNGSTDNRVRVLILDDAGIGKTGVAFNAASLVIGYRIDTGSAVTITLTSGNWFEVGGGNYLVDVADSVYASGNLGKLVTFYGSLPSSTVVAEQHRVTAANYGAVAYGANTTTPPTAAAIADAIWDEDNRDHLLAHSTGKNLDTIRKSNLLVEGTILASPTPTTTAFNVSGVNYPTGAFKHSVLSFAEDATIANQNSPILTYVNNGDGTSTITIEEPLTSAPTAGDKVQIDANSHVHAIVAIVSGVWSAASSGYSAATGTMGLIMYAFSQMLELVTGVWRWKATSLSQAPSGGGSGVVNVLPAVGISAERQSGVVLSPFVGETITQSITLYQTDGTTPINLSGKSLEIVFQMRSGTDVAVIANASITVSGTSSNIVTFAYPSAVTSLERTLRVSLRDNAAPRTVYLSGLCKVSIAPSVDT